MLLESQSETSEQTNEASAAHTAELKPCLSLWTRPQPLFSWSSPRLLLSGIISSSTVVSPQFAPVPLGQSFSLCRANHSFS
ncbi:hypothetical protein INR49_031706 [Caranx melampygus]|nr:hypothetical protein INR49_031706 [Caranx melampygus]